MKYGKLIIEQKEFVLLKRYTNLSGFYKDDTQFESAKRLSKELDTAKICHENEMPYDIVRFNSYVTITSGDGWQKRFQLVMPKDKDVKQDKISILAPIGSAVVGYAEGDDVVWKFPAGEKKLVIAKVEQTEETLDLNTLI